MPADVFEFDPPERFVVGTVGEPGSRTFYLQARGRIAGRPGTVTTSVACEKQQVAVLAERLGELIDEVGRRQFADTPQAPAVAGDLDPLDLPLTEEFRVGAMSLGYDTERDLVVLECFAAVEGDFEQDDEADGTEGERDVLRVIMTQTQTQQFVTRATAVVAAGRPPCPFCEEPLSPSGHICPRANGYRR